MSVDYYLYSPSLKIRAMVASESAAGIPLYPDEMKAMAFIRYAIERFAKDVILVNEDHPDFEWEDDALEGPVADFDEAEPFAHGLPV